MIRTQFLSTLMLSVMLPALALADETANPRTISTSGEAIIYVVPDEVVVNLGVETFDPSLDKSKAENDNLSQSLLKAIRAMGVDEKLIQTEAMTVSIETENYERKVRGYHAQRSYAVRLKDTSKFEPLIDAALKNGANRIYGFEYRTSELRKHRDAARTNAIKAAREKADALAGALGCRIGKPRNINENGGFWGYASYRGNMMGNNFAQVASQAPGGGGGEGGGDEVMPLGQIAVRANVSVVFDLIPE